MKKSRVLKRARSGVFALIIGVTAGEFAFSNNEGTEAPGLLSQPAEGFRLHLESGAGGTDLVVYAAEGFTNRVEIYKATCLAARDWILAVQNLSPQNGSPAVWNAGPLHSVSFFLAGNMDMDSDGDGIPDARERLIYGTDPYNPDSDGDGRSDYEEIYIYKTDPLNDDIMAPTVCLVAPSTDYIWIP